MRLKMLCDLAQPMSGLGEGRLYDFEGDDLLLEIDQEAADILK